jgi:plasmid stabilization system protein ParE
MDCKVLWTSPALKDLTGVLQFIAEDNPDAAERIGQRILGRTDLLQSQPELGSFVGRRPRGEARRLVVGSYIVYYRFRRPDQLVEITHVWHGARRPPLI